MNVFPSPPGAKTRSEVQGVGVQVALDIVYQQDKTDLLTGLQTRTQAGRPNWRKVSKLFS